MSAGHVHLRGDDEGKTHDASYIIIIVITVSGRADVRSPWAKRN